MRLTEDVIEAANFFCRLTDDAAGLSAHGMGRTPAKALADAAEKLRAERDKHQRRPRLVGPGPKALGPAAGE